MPPRGSLSREATRTGGATVPRAVRRHLAPAATVVGVAVVLRIVLDDAWYLNYDARYALIWARDLLDGAGLAQDYVAPFAPTPHPLSIAWSVPAVVVGDWLITWLTLLAFGVVVLLVFRLGRVLFSPAVGVAAALVVLTRPVFLRDVGLGYQDVPFAALVLGAVLLEARERRRGAPVLVLLAFAGLLRPEAWVLAGLYWLYLLPARRAWRDRARLALLVAAAPVLWALMDLAITGDALHSLHGTSDLAAEVGRRRELADAPRWTLRYFAHTLREPLALAIPVGLAFAVAHRARFGRGAGLLVATAGAMVITFALNPLFGLPLISRYVRTPSVLLAVFFGVAVAGWALLEPSRARRVWQGLAALCVLVFVLFLPRTYDSIDYGRRVFHRNAKLYADLRAVGESPAVRRLAAACGPVLAADHRPVAHLRWWLDGPVGTVEGTTATTPRLLLLPRRNVRNRLFWRAEFPRVAPPPGARPAYENRSFRLYTTGCA